MSDFSPRFSTLLDIYDHSTEAFVDNRFLGTKRDGAWQWMTYGQFREQVDATRAGLAGLGVEKGDRVAIISDNREEWAVAAYAAYGLGGVVVPMYEAQTDDNWKYILGNSEAVVAFLASDEIRDRVGALRDDLPNLAHLVVFVGEPASGSTLLSQLQEAGRTAPVPLADVKPGDTAGFIYTSGTTGNPKGVVLSHGNLASNASAVTDVFPLEESDGSLSILPWAHAFGQTVELHTLFSVGCSTGFVESTRHVVSNLNEIKPTMLVAVPRVFNTIYRGVQDNVAAKGGVTKFMFDQAMANASKRRQLAAEGKTSRLVEMQQQLFDRLVFSKIRDRFGGRIKYAISGGAAISREVAEFVDSLGVVVYEGYGLSETSPIVTANVPGSRKIGSVGVPIPGVQVEIDEAASGDPRDGEIVVHGHCVMQGYHNLPEADTEVFTEDGGFRTGDLGRIDDDGFLFITGRVKEQYKLENGKYVVPTVIEEKIALSPYIANVLVYGANRPYNVAVVVPEVEALESWLDSEGMDFASFEQMSQDPKVRGLIKSEIENATNEFPRYERIRNFVLLEEDFTTDNGMLTPTLKVKRRIVIDRYGDDIEHLYSSASG